MNICLDYVGDLGGWCDKEGNLHWHPYKIPTYQTVTGDVILITGEMIDGQIVWRETSEELTT